MDKILIFALVLISLISCNNIMDDIHTTEDKEGSSISYNKKECDSSFEDDTLHIFIPIEYGDIEYVFVHEDIPSKNSNIWRIDKVYANTKEERIELTTKGEWECAIRLEGQKGFSGGKMHGYEILTEFKVFADGNAITDMKSVPDFDILSVFQTSYLLIPDKKTIFAEHKSEHRWSKNGLEINQTVEWLSKESVISSYMAMFPASKSIFDKYNTDVVQDTLPLSGNLYLKNVKSVKLYGKSNIQATFSVSKFTPTNNFFLVSDNGKDTYWKCYYVNHGSSPSIVQKGEIWESNAKYEFKIKEERNEETTGIGVVYM